jgi:hypothetical protein
MGGKARAKGLSAKRRKRSLVGGRIARRQFFLARNSFLDFFDRRFNAFMTPIRANIVGPPNVATRSGFPKDTHWGRRKLKWDE